MIRSAEERLTIAKENLKAVQTPSTVQPPSAAPNAVSSANNAKTDLVNSDKLTDTDITAPQTEIVPTT
jgi:hypothetical protein